MARTRLFCRCLAFDSLDAGNELRGTFTVGYRFLDCPEDLWTERFTSFKAGNPQAVRAGSRIVSRMARSVLSELDILASDVTFVPALSSQEITAASDSSLARTAKRCAKKYQATVDYTLLRKKRHRRLHTGSRTLAQREELIAAAAYESGNVNTRNIVVIDDLVTAGSTLCAIARAIRARNPSVSVFGMALAKNERRSYLAGSPSTNDHIRPKWDRIWRSDQ